MRCKRARSLLSELIDGTLTREVRKRLEVHLKGCTGCEEEHRELLGVHHTIRAAHRFSAPQGFAARVIENLPAGDVTGDALAGTSLLYRLWTSGSRFLQLAEAAAVVLAVIAGVIFGGFLSDKLFTVSESATLEAGLETAALSHLDYLDPVPPESIAVAYFAMQEGRNER